MLITDLSLFNSQKLETAQMPINMDKKIMVKWNTKLLQYTITWMDIKYYA